jgi:hypothetical protein
MFARQRDPGLWTFDSVITGAELEYWDASIANAIDGLNGGAYSLTADVTIGGDPFVAWVFDLQTTFNGGTIFSSTALFTGDVTLQGLATFDGGTTFNGAVILNDYANFFGAADFQDNLTVLGIASLQGGVNLSGAVAVSGPTTFSSAASADFAGTVTTSGSGAMRVRRVRRQTIGGDAPATIDVTLTDHVTVPAGVLSASQSYTISDTGAVNGDRVRFSNFDTGFGITIKKPDTISLLSVGGAGGVPTWCDVERINGEWKAFPGPNNP